MANSSATTNTQLLEYKHELRENLNIKKQNKKLFNEFYGACSFYSSTSRTCAIHMI